MKNKIGMDMEKLLQNWRQAEVRELSISGSKRESGTKRKGITYEHKTSNNRRF